MFSFWFASQWKQAMRHSGASFGQRRWLVSRMCSLWFQQLKFEPCEKSRPLTWPLFAIKQSKSWFRLQRLDVGLRKMNRLVSEDEALLFWMQLNGAFHLSSTYLDTFLRYWNLLFIKFWWNKILVCGTSLANWHLLTYTCILIKNGLQLFCYNVFWIRGHKIVSISTLLFMTDQQSVKIL